MDEFESAEIYLKDLPVNRKRQGIDGRFVRLQGEAFYRIRDYDVMPPFLMSTWLTNDSQAAADPTGRSGGSSRAPTAFSRRGMS